MRKVKDKYVFVYSRKTKEGEFGLGASNYTLAYAYGDTPLGPWTYGGTLVDDRARETDQNGKVICSQMSYGNTHGSILEINGQWYLFYHRCINNDMYSRQATVSAEIDSLSSIEGKHALYFVFKSSGSSVLCELNSFQFGDSTVTDEDEGQDVKPEESPAPGETPSPTPTLVPGNMPSPSPTVPSSTVPPLANQSEASLAVGKVYTVGNFTYKITKADTSGKGTVLLVGTKNKKIKSIQVPDTIKIKGTKFHVAGIGKAAFKGCKLATRAVIGKYVSVIENSAFESCGKLKKINLKTTTLKKIGKKAFKGIHKKARFTVPKKQLKKYKKIFKSAKVIKKSMKISG